jgi:RHS repeat-associated protein
VANRFVYDPYGKGSQYDASWNLQGGIGNGTWFYFFQGGRFDAITGLYNFRNRDYSTTLGRWMQEDPIAYKGGSDNLYSFVGDDPYKATDPYGQKAADGLGGSLGLGQNFQACWPIPWGAGSVSVCFVGTLEGYYTKCCGKICTTGLFSGSIGLYITGTLGGRPGKGETWWSNFAPDLGRYSNMISNLIASVRSVVQGNLLGALIAFLKGTPAVIARGDFGCPPEGLTFNVCATASFGFSSWSAGCRGCYSYPGGNTYTVCGLGVGQGSGVSISIGLQYTKCW